MTTEKTTARHGLSALWLIGAGCFFGTLAPIILPLFIDLCFKYTNDIHTFTFYTFYLSVSGIIADITVLAGILWLRSQSRHRALRMCLTGIGIAMVLSLGLDILSIFEIHAADDRINIIINLCTISILYILWIGSFALIRQGLPRNDSLSMRIERIQNVRMIQLILVTIGWGINTLLKHDEINTGPLHSILGWVGLAVAFCFAVYLIQGLYALIRDERFFPRSADGTADPKIYARPRIVSASAVGALCGCATAVLCCILYAERF